MTRLKAAMIATFLLVFGIAWAADNRFIVEVDGQEPDTTDISAAGAAALIDGSFVRRTAGDYTNGEADVDLRMWNKAFDAIQMDPTLPAARFQSTGSTPTVTIRNPNKYALDVNGLVGLQATGTNAAGIFNGSVQIDGTSDANQLYVHGNATQTGEIFVVDKSDNTDLFTVNNAGLATAVNLKATAMTAGRAAYYGTSGLLAGDAGFTYSDSNDAITLTGGADATRLTATANATQTNNQAIFESSAGTDYVIVGPPTVPTDGTKTLFKVIGTFPSNNTAAVDGMQVTITGADNEAFQQRGLNVTYSAGYTGTNFTMAGRFRNESAGTGSNLEAFIGGNTGFNGAAVGTTTGHNSGVRGHAEGGGRSYGGLFDAYTNKSGAVNVGAAGIALNTAGGGAINVGVAGVLTASRHTFASAGVYASNGTATDPIFLAQDNTTSVFTIANGGVITSTGQRIYTPSASQAITAVGNTILADSAIVEINPDANYTLTSTPTIADGTKGEIVRIIVASGEANTVTVQDESGLAGSNLQLGAATRVIGDNDVLTLLFNGTYWVEDGYTDN